MNRPHEHIQLLWAALMQQEEPADVMIMHAYSRFDSLMLDGEEQMDADERAERRDLCDKFHAYARPKTPFELVAAV